MEETQINWHSSDEEIKEMGYLQAIEILENSLSRTGQQFGPRKHYARALELGIEAMRIVHDRELRKSYNDLLGKDV